MSIEKSAIINIVAEVVDTHVHMHIVYVIYIKLAYI